MTGVRARWPIGSGTGGLVGETPSGLPSRVAGALAFLETRSILSQTEAFPAKGRITEKVGHQYKTFYDSEKCA
jgi:hypothetical protein